MAVSRVLLCVMILILNKNAEFVEFGIFIRRASHETGIRDFIPKITDPTAPSGDVRLTKLVHFIKSSY